MSTPNRPNEHGFSGDPTVPQPDRSPESPAEAAEEIAVPDDDLTDAAGDAILDVGQ
jgi:hypothetical protein